MRIHRPGGHEGRKEWSMDWIIKYAIMKVDTSSPMYGHDQTLDVLDDKDKAIEKAKRLSLTYKNICVEERRYASSQNLQKGITFDQSICWAYWMTRP